MDRILAATNCQPYRIQTTCRDLVNALNEEKRVNATVADAERALESALTSATLYFKDLWQSRDSDDTQREILRALERIARRRISSRG